MLQYIGWNEPADCILESLKTTIMRKRVTIDFYNLMHDATLLKTSEFAQELIKNIGAEPPIAKGE